MRDEKMVLLLDNSDQRKQQVSRNHHLDKVPETPFYTHLSYVGLKFNFHHTISFLLLTVHQCFIARTCGTQQADITILHVIETHALGYYISGL